MASLSRSAERDEHQVSINNSLLVLYDYVFISLTLLTIILSQVIFDKLIEEVDKAQPERIRVSFATILLC